MIHLLKKSLHYYYHDMNLQSKFIITYLILALTPTLVVSILLYSQLSDATLNNTIHRELGLARQNSGDLGSIVNDVNVASNRIISDNFFMELLRYNSEDEVAEIVDANQEFINNSNLFLNSANTLVDGVNITNIKIYLDDTYQSLYNHPSTTGYDIYRSINDIKGSYWYGIFGSTNKRMLVCPSLYLTPTEAHNYGEFSIVRKLSYSDNPKSTAAYVVVYFSKENVNSTLNQNISISDAATYLINEKDGLVSSSNSKLAGKYFLTYRTLEEIVPDNNSFGTYTFASDKTYMNYRKVQGTDWYLVTALPVNNVLRQNREILIKFIIIYLMFLVISYVFATKLSKSIVKRISYVINQMNMVQHNTPERIVMEPDYDEIGELVNTYNYMTDEINDLLDKETRAANELRIAEFKALQSQINPHFLYNTLDMINWLSKDGKSSEVSEAIQALSKFYKLTLGTGNVTVSIREELSHVSLYVKLQNMRYKNKIHFIIDVPDELLDYEMPKLILQPIVENSIQHGIFSRETKEGTIVIMGWAEAEELVFIISDDGTGIPPEKIKELLKRDKVDDKGNHIGIYNTHRRLQLFYGDNFGLTYRSKENIETEVEIRIPAKKIKVDGDKLLSSGRF